MYNPAMAQPQMGGMPAMNQPMGGGMPGYGQQPMGQ